VIKYGWIGTTKHRGRGESCFYLTGRFYNCLHRFPGLPSLRRDYRMNVVNFNSEDLEVALALALAGVCLCGGIMFGVYGVYLLITALIGGGL